MNAGYIHKVQRLNLFSQVIAMMRLAICQSFSSLQAIAVLLGTILQNNVIKI